MLLRPLTFRNRHLKLRERAQGSPLHKGCLEMLLRRLTPKSPPETASTSAGAAAGRVRSIECSKCHEIKALTEFNGPNREKIARGHEKNAKCWMCTTRQHCKDCGQSLPLGNFLRRRERISQRCQACEFPYCSSCGREATEVVALREKIDGRIWYRKEEN